MSFGWLRRLLGTEFDEDDVPPGPEPIEKMSPEELEEHRKEIARREATLRVLETKARLKGRKPWWT